MAEQFKTDFIDGLDANATQTDVPKPNCDREQEARGDGYSVSSSSSDTVYWCFGMDANHRRLLKVTDHRRYPLQVLHPNMQVVANTVDWSALPTLSHLASSRYTIIAPGGTATFGADLAAGTSEGIQTEMDGFGQSLYALDTGVEALVSILTRFGAGSDISVVNALANLLAIRSCADALGKGSGELLAGCFDPHALVEALGTKAVLLAPLMIFGPVLSFFRSEWNALVDQFNGHDQYRVVLRRAAPTATIAAFAGLWEGHTRALTISASGVGQEHVGNGCCDEQIDLTFQLSNVEGTSPTSAVATATVTAVHVYPGWSVAYSGAPPHVGQQGAVSISGGVLTEHLADAIYCTNAEAAKGTCGA